MQRCLHPPPSTILDTFLQSFLSTQKRMMIGKYNTDIAAFLAEVENVTTGTAAEEDSENEKATIKDSYR